MDVIMLALAAAVSVLVSPAAGGFAAPTAQLTQTAEGASVHGAVCRRQILNARAPWGVRLQMVDAKGDVLETATSPLIGGGLSGRGVGCAYYTAHLKGPLPSGVRILVTAER
jgi:hypothetical protein